jgi:hypothetical protein
MIIKVIVFLGVCGGIVVMIYVAAYVGVCLYHKSFD